jgi:serine phosphatase RsbU (regulator of sigma subunit)/DNA-binding NarL/FixJ family response regulator
MYLPLSSIFLYNKRVALPGKTKNFATRKVSIIHGLIRTQTDRLDYFMTQIKPIRVAIVEDWSVIRAGLGSFLRATPDLNLVAEAGDGEEALQLCGLVQPDVILVDLDLPDVDSPTLVEALHQQWPFIKIIGFSRPQNEKLAQRILESGAAGVLLKSASAEEVVKAIREIYIGAPAASSSAPLDTTESQIEKLAAALDTIMLDAAQLSGLLHQFLPKILPRCQGEVIMFPHRTLYAFPGEHLEIVPERVWSWMRSRPEPCVYSAGEKTPWGETVLEKHTLILVPIPSTSGREVVGAIGVDSISGHTSLSDPLTLVCELAKLLSKALEKALTLGARPERHNLVEELAMAGRIQAEILPARAPKARGWDFAACLVPALETSGDFYDFIRLPNNNLGIVIADVSDKGMGAALFMALSSTLVRTYASQYATLPSFALGMANERILLDTRSGMFVTAFYGVLEPDTGRMRYVNAGHNPPYMFSTQKNKTLDWLRPTGMALGVMEDATWSQKVIKFSPGDVLLLYTDGITDALDEYGNYYGEKRLQEVIRSKRDCSAAVILDAVLGDLQRFTGGMPQQDDITMVVISRLLHPEFG